MLNGKLKSHFQLWDALLKVEKLFETKDAKVIIKMEYFLHACTQVLYVRGCHFVVSLVCMHRWPP